MPWKYFQHEYKYKKNFEIFETYKNEIISMCHRMKLNILISLSNDSLVKILKDKDFDYMNTIIYFMSKKLDANKIFIFYSTIFFLGKIILYYR